MVWVSLRGLVYVLSYVGCSPNSSGLLTLVAQQLGLIYKTYIQSDSRSFVQLDGFLTALHRGGFPDVLFGAVKGSVCRSQQVAGQ
jgi:hypothetical protein